MLLEFFRKRDAAPESLLAELKESTDLLKGSIHIEDIYIELMIKRMDTLIQLQRLEDAA